MKIKFNYFFFVALFVAPLIGALIALPYGLFIASTPYYFSWPFGGFWQEFFVLVIIIIFLYSLLFGYIALPWLAVIREDRIVFHRLFRRRLVLTYRDMERVEFLCNHMPIENYRYGLGHLLIYKKNKDRIFVGGVPHSVVIELREKLKRLGIEVDISTRNLTKEEIKDMQEGKIKK